MQAQMDSATAQRIHDAAQMLPGAPFVDWLVNHHGETNGFTRTNPQVEARAAADLRQRRLNYERQKRPEAFRPNPRNALNPN